MGLALGGSLSNAVVFSDKSMLNVDGFRYSDECVRHKILDLMGDLALTGRFVLGSFEVCKAGHALHSRFLKLLMARPAGRVSSSRLATVPGAYAAAALLNRNRFPKQDEPL